LFAMQYTLLESGTSVSHLTANVVLNHSFGATGQQCFDRWSNKSVRDQKD